MLTAYESLLTLPVPYRAHYRHHQMLWSILAAQGIGPEAGQNRLNVLFLPSPLGRDCTRLLLRAPQPLGLPGEQATGFQFIEREPVELLVKISLSFPVRNETGARRTVYAGEQDRHRYIANKYARYGLDCTGCEVVSDERLSIQKPGQSLFLPCVTAKITGRVINSNDFARSFIEGVGGKKAFGAELPLLISGGSKRIKERCPPPAARSPKKTEALMLLRGAGSGRREAKKMHNLNQKVSTFFEQLSLTTGASKRPEQLSMTMGVAGDLGRDDTRGISLINADTGIGKSLAYLVPVLLHAAKTRQRVFIATHTLQLMRQLNQRDLPLVFQYLQRHHNLHLNRVTLLGKRNFLSRSRLHLWATVQGERLAPDDRQLLAALCQWSDEPEASGVIGDFIKAYGKLPGTMQPEDICLTLTCGDSPHYQENRDQAAAANVVLTTYAMVVLESLIGVGVIPSPGGSPTAAKIKQLPDILVIDEADAPIDEYQQPSQRRLNLKQALNSVAGSASKPLQQALEEVISALEQEGAEGGYPSFRESTTLEPFERLRRLARVDRDRSLAIAEFHSQLDGLFSSTYYGALGTGFSQQRHDPALIKVSPRVARRFARYVQEQFDYCLLTSATLSVTGTVEGFDWFAVQLGIDDDQVISRRIFSPARFGTLNLCRVDEQWPWPFEKSGGGGLNEPPGLSAAWLDRVADCLRNLMNRGANTLV